MKGHLIAGTVGVIASLFLAALTGWKVYEAVRNLEISSARWVDTGMAASYSASSMPAYTSPREAVILAIVCGLAVIFVVYFVALLYLLIARPAGDDREFAKAQLDRLVYVALAAVVGFVGGSSGHGGAPATPARMSPTPRFVTPPVAPDEEEGPAPRTPPPPPPGAARRPR